MNRQQRGKPATLWKPSNHLSVGNPRWYHRHFHRGDWTQFSWSPSIRFFFAANLPKNNQISIQGGRVQALVNSNYVEQVGEKMWRFSQIANLGRQPHHSNNPGSLSFSFCSFSILLPPWCCCDSCTCSEGTTKGSPWICSHTNGLRK